MNQIDYDTEEAVRRFLTLLASSYSMAGAIVYGTRARGTHRPDRDADVVVLLEKGINISPLPVWVDEWERPERFSNPTLLYNIAREGVRL